LVWLILLTGPAFFFAQTPFQFHIGMINPSFIDLLISSSYIFQFHIGMINPEIIGSDISYLIFIFQFHIGMINPG